MVFMSGKKKNKDWVKYQSKFDFQFGLVSYLAPPSTAFLENSGINMADTLNSIQSTVAG